MERTKIILRLKKVELKNYMIKKILFPYLHLTKVITVHPTFWQLVRKIKTRNHFLFYTEESLQMSRVILLQQDA